MAGSRWVLRSDSMSVEESRVLKSLKSDSEGFSLRQCGGQEVKGAGCVDGCTEDPHRRRADA